MSQFPIKLSEAVYDNGNSSSAFAIDWNNGVAQRLQLTDNCLIQLNNPTAKTYYYLFLRQDGTGNRLPRFPSYVRFVNGTPPTAIASNLSQMYRFYWNGVNYLCDFTTSFNESVGGYVLTAAGVIDPASNLAWNWGTNGSGQIGNGNTTNSSNPVVVPYRVFSSLNKNAYSSYGIDYYTGMIWAWGQGNNGELGNNTKTTVSSPITISRSASYTSIGSNLNGSAVTAFAIDASTGMIWAWGNGTYLGNNTTTTVSSPVTIARSASYSFVTGSASTSGGGAFAIDAATGMIWAWGLNSSGQLGNNSTTSTSSPVTIARSTSYSYVAGGNQTSGAIDKATGMIWCWGQGASGELGNNTVTGVSSPVTIARSASYTSVVIGMNYGLAIDAATGMVYAWGSNESYALGINTFGTRSVSSPVTIARSASYSKIAIMNTTTSTQQTSYALESNGTVWAWGYNGSQGNLGNSRNTVLSSPITIARSASYTQIGACDGAIFAIDGSTGMIYSWGSNTTGGLGANSLMTTPAVSPVTIARSASYSAVCGGWGTGFAIDAATGMIWAWGRGTNGVLGNNSTTQVYSPVTIARSASYVAIATGNTTTGSDTVYAIDGATGMVWAWGQGIGSGGAGGPLGNNSTTTRSSPVTIARSASYSAVAGNTNTSKQTGAGYAIDAATGMIWAWGSNTNSLLGNNSSANTSSPVTIARSASYSKIATNGLHGVYAIDGATGMIWVWGANGSGQLGTNTVTTYSSPVTIARSASYSAVVGGNSGSNALAIDAATGMVWAWGSGSNGMLGNNSITNRSSPVTIARSASYSAIGMAGASAAAFAVDATTGVVYAWGSNTSGLLGNLDTSGYAMSPVSVARIFPMPSSS